MYKCHHYQRTNNDLTLLDNQVVHKVKEQSFPHFPHTLLACSLTSVHARMLYTFKKLVASCFKIKACHLTAFLACDISPHQCVTLYNIWSDIFFSGKMCFIDNLQMEVHNVPNLLKK